MRDRGCVVGQGYLFSKPLPAEACGALLGKCPSEADHEDDMLAAFASQRA